MEPEDDATADDRGGDSNFPLFQRTRENWSAKATIFHSSTEQAMWLPVQREGKKAGKLLDVQTKRKTGYHHRAPSSIVLFLAAFQDVTIVRSWEDSTTGRPPLRVVGSWVGK